MAGLLEPQVDDYPRKGLRVDAVGFLSSLTVGVASIAPAFSLAANLVWVVLAVGNQAAAMMIQAFIPTALTAVA